MRQQSLKRTKLQAEKILLERFSNYIGRNKIVIIPAEVKLVRTVETDTRSIQRTCPNCGMTIRQITETEMHCFNCGYAEQVDAKVNIVSFIDKGGIRPA